MQSKECERGKKQENVTLCTKHFDFRKIKKKLREKSTIKSANFFLLLFYIVQRENSQLKV